ncbi:MAG: hypothetical protein M5U01_24000 [Ardenticatenaceae bacterium]|nr:hypothetical protein [Ardenticatenaceae bacterium]
MTLTVTLDLTPEMEAELRRSLYRHDTAQVRQLLAEALIPTVKELMQQVPAPVADEEWDTVAAQLINEVAANLPPESQPLSDAAVSRAGIYEDHP